MFNKTDELLLLFQMSRDDSLIRGQKYCCTNIPFMGKIHAISNNYGLVRTKSVTTQLVLYFAQENEIDLNSVGRVR